MTPTECPERMRLLDLKTTSRKNPHFRSHSHRGRVATGTIQRPRIQLSFIFRPDSRFVYDIHNVAYHFFMEMGQVEIHGNLLTRLYQFRGAVFKVGFR